ncbi:MAG: hypothetical protein ABR915_07415 [Thermoguttaceae bacterium]|jgi:RsiW-degrading membrane proteinase PrsW (M82 family)
MYPVFALTGIWELCGGHVTLGSIIAYVIARAFYENSRNFWGAVVLYYTVCVVFWIICDWIWGPYLLPSTYELPRY